MAHTVSPRMCGAKATFSQRVGARIRALREMRGWSQTDLARQLPGSTDSGQVSRWERGLAFPNPISVDGLARAFEVSEERVLCGCEGDHSAGDPRRRR
jgi:transcriptional regulator with XRE-family HTH domain